MVSAFHNFNKALIMFRKIFVTRAFPQPVAILLLLLRLCVAGFMLTHGGPKLLKLFSGDLKFADPIGLGPEISFVLVVFAEFFCSLLILIGLFTRLATIPLLITMFVALLIVHADDPFEKKDTIVAYIAGYMILLVTGAGRYSVDYKLWKEGQIES
jgi:putative oxidoreductase